MGIRGRTWREFYRNAARGLVAVYAPQPGSSEQEGRGRADRPWVVQASGETPEDTLVAWLNELIYQASTRARLPLNLRILSASDRQVRAECREALVPLRGQLSKEVKAATYHALQVRRSGRGGWSAQVVLDV